MPHRQFVSRRAQALSGLFFDVRERTFKQQRRMTLDLQAMVGRNICERIQQIEIALRNEEVRIHLDTSFGSPEVTELSVLNTLFTRLKRQVYACCELIDLCASGPDFNYPELFALSKMEQLLNLIDRATTPSNRPATDSD